MSPSDPRLSPLRNEIAEIDRSLLELLRRRIELAAEVGRIKAASGAPIVVRDVEDQVLGRARQHAESCGVSEDVLADIFTAIIRGSVERQHRVGIALREKHGRRVLIVGGAGGMGTWFHRFLEIAGHAIDLVDPAYPAAAAGGRRFPSLAAVGDLDLYDVLLVAVPLARTPAVLGELAARAPRGLVVEIASIKAGLEPALADARDRGVRILALHPMFGPSKSPYEPLTFLLAAQADPEAERGAIEPFLSHPYTRLMVVPFAHHDRLMAWLLGLSHLTNLIFGAAITGSGISPEELRACASTTFTRQAGTALSVLSEDSDLYLDIQHLNPHRHEVYRAVRESVDRLETMVEERDRDGFGAAMAAARQALAGD